MPYLFDGFFVPILLVQTIKGEELKLFSSQYQFFKWSNEGKGFLLLLSLTLSLSLPFFGFNLKIRISFSSSSLSLIRVIL